MSAISLLNELHLSRLPFPTYRIPSDSCSCVIMSNHVYHTRVWLLFMYVVHYCTQNVEKGFQNFFNLNVDR